MNFDRFCYKVKSENGWWLEYFVGEWKGCISELRTHPQQEYATAIAKTLCQCTGIRDSKGKRVYEHDILTIVRVSDKSVIADNVEVEYDHLQWFYSINGERKLLNNLVNHVFAGLTYEFYVVGNVFDEV